MEMEVEVGGDGGFRCGHGFFAIWERALFCVLVIIIGISDAKTRGDAGCEKSNIASTGVEGCTSTPPDV